MFEKGASFGMTRSYNNRKIPRNFWLNPAAARPLAVKGVNRAPQRLTHRFVLIITELGVSTGLNLPRSRMQPHLTARLEGKDDTSDSPEYHCVIND